MTELEKRIYNKHLAVSRSLKNKPFKLRTNFTDFEKDSKYVSVKRLSNFFTRHNDVDMDLYFTAPYKLYTDVDFFDLNYFASPRAIKSYSIYKNQILQTSPDQQIESVKESLRFIVRFCLEKKINFEDYTSYRQTALEPTWVYHYKRGLINPYSIMEFPNTLDFIQSMNCEERNLLFGSFGDNFFIYKSNYLNSKNLRPFLKEAFIKMKFFVDKNLHNQ
jgi:hypothetical protein